MKAGKIISRGFSYGGKWSNIRAVIPYLFIQYGHLPVTGLQGMPDHVVKLVIHDCNIKRNLSGLLYQNMEFEADQVKTPG